MKWSLFFFSFTHVLVHLSFELLLLLSWQLLLLLFIYSRRTMVPVSFKSSYFIYILVFVPYFNVISGNMGIAFIFRTINTVILTSKERNIHRHFRNLNHR